MNTEHDWLVWWHDEGSGMRPVNGQDHESHVRDMTRIAWLNGAFSSADEIERLRAERDEARRSVCDLCVEAGGVFRRVGGKIVEVTTPEGCAEIMRWDCFDQTPNDIEAHEIRGDLAGGNQ